MREQKSPEAPLPHKNINDEAEQSQTPLHLSTTELNDTPQKNQDEQPQSTQNDAQLPEPEDIIVRLCDHLLLPQTTTTTALLIYNQATVFLKETEDKPFVSPLTRPDEISGMANTNNGNGSTKDSSLKNGGYAFTQLLILACVQVATKSTEEHRKLRDIFNCFYFTMHGRFMPVNEDYWRMRDSVGKVEFVLLRILRFHLAIPLAYPFILRIVNAMMQQQQQQPASDQPIDQNLEATRSALLQVSMTLANDAYCLNSDGVNLGSLHSPRVIAVGCVYVALRSFGMKLPIEFTKWVQNWSGKRPVEEVEAFVKALLQLADK
ncbi:hypothetical protein MP638_000684 [Amoeboaphelidium occidentale]|nr:hypothetical protein MP638_000684 [Amoeboaphelidium occidentale]